jgi:hypothetical protein
MARNVRTALADCKGGERTDSAFKPLKSAFLSLKVSKIGKMNIKGLRAVPLVVAAGLVLQRVAQGRVSGRLLSAEFTLKRL